MVLEKEAFVPYRLEEERAKDKRRVISVAFNAEELKDLEKQCDLLDTQNEGTVIKLLWAAGWRNLQVHFSDQSLRWMSRRDRARLYGPKGPD